MPVTCPNCGQEYDYGSTCPYCKVDTVLYTGTTRISDALYNKALAKIKVSDLSGAIDCLSKSISINKNNTQARNLLGLVQFEIGHAGEALKNWVISANFKREDNDAAGYISSVQKNARALEKFNDAIRIYNQALNDIYQKSDDMAIIKLKQAVDLNPKFVDALNLLTLCYLIQKDRTRAAATAERVLAIDSSNTIALNYYSQISPSAKPGRGLGKKRAAGLQNAAAPADNQQGSPVTPYKKVVLHERRNVNFHIEGILALVIGIVCTLGVMFVLVLPSIESAREAQVGDMMTTLYRTEQAFNEMLEEKEQTIEELEVQLEILGSDVESWATRYDALDRTFLILNAFDLLRDGRVREAVDAIGGVDVSGLSPDIAERAQEVRDTAYPQLAQQYHNEGLIAYRASPPDLQKARVDFERAYRYAHQVEDFPLMGDLLYYMAWTYSRIEMYDEAIHYFERMLEEFPNHRHFWPATNRLNAIR